MPCLQHGLTNGGNRVQTGGKLSHFFYKLLFNGLLACSGIVSLIIAVILWRRMWVEGKAFSELGTEGNGVIFMAVLVAISLLIAWRIKKAKAKLN